jgi:hypothetical protein
MKNTHMGKPVEDYSAPARIRRKVIQICERCDVSADWLLGTEANV